MAISHPLLSIEFFTIISHFPFYALIYAVFLSILAALTLYLFSLFHEILPLDVGQNMFAFLSVIVGWLVTTRPAYALSMHDILTDLVNQIFISLDRLARESPLEAGLLLEHLTMVVLKGPSFHTNNTNQAFQQNIFSKSAIKIMDQISTFQLKSQLALPRPLHGLCILLVIGFHGVLVPLLLFDEASFYALIPNFILAVYTSGCLEVAITISVPYSGVTLQNHSIAADQFQTQYHRVLNALIKVNSSKLEKTILRLKAMPIPIVLGETDPNTKNEDEHPCKVFILERA